MGSMMYTMANKLLTYGHIIGDYTSLVKGPIEISEK